MNLEEASAEIASARSLLPKEFSDALEGRFFQNPVLILALLRSMAFLARSRSAAGMQWEHIHLHLSMAKEAAEALGP